MSTYNPKYRVGRSGKSNSESRRTTARITLRFLPEEMEGLKSAVSKSSEPWRGLSYHLRSALMVWTRAMLSPLADARMRPAGKARTKRSA